MKTALLQICSSDDPDHNLGVVSDLIRKAASEGADFVLTPEVTNIVSVDREHQAMALHPQDSDPFLAALCNLAADLRLWLSIGSLALKGGAGGRFVNRSFLIDPSGEIQATYDKIHMFDVQLSETESYRESSGYAPGSRAVVAETTLGKIGMTICYDLRFPHLHRALAQAGADIILVPSAFSPATGAAHWEPLLRSRAIETGCFVLAAAQSGTHQARSGKQRVTYGHSIAISPWGEVLADAGTETGMTIVDIDLSEVAKARGRVPSLLHDRSFDGPV